MTKPVGYLTNPFTGTEGEPGVFYDYVLAAGGVYLKAKNAHLAATVCIAPGEIRGLAPLKEDLRLLHGKVPLYLLNLALSVLIAKPDIEQCLAIIWAGAYELKIPPQQAAAGSVTYETLPDTLLEIHSHTNEVPALFSIIDDRDEQGFGLYAVAADMSNLCPTVELRLGIYGYFLPVKQSEIFT